MNESDISSSIAKLSSEFSKLGASAKELSDVHKRCAEAFEKAIDDSIRRCAMFMSKVYELGITDPLERIRTSTIRRLIVRKKKRKIVRLLCQRCEYYQQRCEIVKMLPKGRW